MSHLIKFTDPEDARRDEIMKREEEADKERIIKSPTHFDKLDSDKSKALIQKDKVTEKIRQQGKEKVRFYKFTHPEKKITLFGNVIAGQDMPETVRKCDGIWISPEEYYMNTNDAYAEMKGKGRIKLVNSLLDIEIVRDNPEFEKAIRTRG